MTPEEKLIEELECLGREGRIVVNPIDLPTLAKFILAREENLRDDWTTSLNLACAYQSKLQTAVEALERAAEQICVKICSEEESSPTYMNMGIMERGLECNDVHLKVHGYINKALADIKGKEQK